MVCLPVLVPSASAAPAPATDRLSATVAIEASLETAFLSVSAQATAEVDLFGVQWDLGSFTSPVRYDLIASATFSGGTDTCTGSADGTVTADASLETAPEGTPNAFAAINVQLHAEPLVAECSILDVDIVMDLESQIANSFGGDPATGEVAVDTASSWAVSLQVLDARTGTPIAGHNSASAFRAGIVVDPSEPDKSGRVKVQFHWDVEDTSNWIRVAHPHTTGSVIIPRIGWETVVEGATFAGESLRREEFRVLGQSPSGEPLEMVFRGQAMDLFDVIAQDLVDMGTVVGAEGGWKGLVIEGGGEVPGASDFDSSIQLRDLRRPAAFDPVEDRQRHSVRSPAVVRGEGLSTQTPLVRFGAAVEAPARSPIPLRVVQGSQFDPTGTQYPDFQFRITLNVGVQAWRPGGGTNPALALGASLEVTIRGDANSGEAEAEIRHRMFAIVDRSNLPPITVEVSATDFVSIPLSPPPPNAPGAHGKVTNLKQISLGLSERSRLFAVWTTVGFFRVTQGGYDVTLDGRIELEGNVDPPDAPDPVWVDLGVGYHIGGRKFKPLFAAYIADLDNKVDVRFGGTRVGAQGGLRTPTLFGPGGLLEPRPFFDVIATTPTDSFEVRTESEALAAVQGDVFQLEFAGQAVG